MARAKGVHAIKITWVKGHVKQKHIDAGISDATKKYGNDTADDAANQGAQLNGSDLLKVASHFNLRHCTYIKFIVNIVKHIVEGYIIHRAFCPPDKQQLQGEGEKYDPLHYAEHCNSRLLDPISSIECYGNIAKKRAARDIENFLAQLQVQACGATPLRGCTWIELYVLYRLRGGTTMFADPVSKLTPKATADKRLRAFKNLVRAIVERTLAQGADRDLFRPGPAAKDQLRGVGVLGKLPNLGFNVVCSQREKEAIAVAISSLARTEAIQKHKDFVFKELQLKPRILKLKGRAAWDISLPSLTSGDEGPSWWSKKYAHNIFLLYLKNSWSGSPKPLIDLVCLSEG